jgi:hypothetical protein
VKSEIELEIYFLNSLYFHNIVIAIIEASLHIKLFKGHGYFTAACKIAYRTAASFFGNISKSNARAFSGWDFAKRCFVVGFRL